MATTDPSQPIDLNTALALLEGPGGFESLIDNLNSGVFISTLEGRFLHVSAPTARMAGFDRIEDALALPAPQLYANPEDRQKFIALLKEHGEVNNLEVLSRRKDGSTYWLALSGRLISDAEGIPRIIMGAVRDINELKKTMDNLRASEARYHALFESLDAGVMIMREATCIECNAATVAMFGVARRDELIGANPMTFAPPVQPDGTATAVMVADIMRLVMEKGSHRFDWLTAKKDCSPLYLDVTLSQLKMGEETLLQCIALDITQRVCAAAEREALLAREQAARVKAEDAVRARDDFMSIASHELRTPLAALKIASEGVQMALDRGSLSESLLRRVVETVDRQVVRLIRLVTNLLDVTRVRTGSFTLLPEPVDLVAAIHAVVKRLEPSLVQAGCAVQIHGADALPGFFDRDRIEQVIENLLSNAMKFAGGKPIEIAMELGDDTLEICVRDHGPGIDAGIREKIFNLYERGESARHHGGLGMGLFICREIIRLHRGEIHVENAEDGGARIRIRLPRQPD